MEENYCSVCGMEMDKDDIECKECKRDKEKEEKAIYDDVMNMEYESAEDAEQIWEEACEFGDD